MLTDDAQIATWNNEGLPSDRMSTENATILCNCERWPLMIDPQLQVLSLLSLTAWLYLIYTEKLLVLSAILFVVFQGIKWVKTRYAESLIVVRLGQKGYLDRIEHAVMSGDVVLIENIEESIDPVLDPLLGRNLIKKGRYIKMGDKEVEYNKAFKLILQTKVSF